MVQPLSNPYRRKLSLAGIDASNMSIVELRALVNQIMKAGIHGISFSPYTEGQGPGAPISASQVRERLEIIRPHVEWIRTFSCSDGNELIPEIAADMGLKSMVGVWLDDDRGTNEAELERGIEIAKRGFANVLAIGNEVLLRGELSEDELIDYITRARTAIPNIKVGYVDAYFQFETRPQLTDACDVILANCYPFWEGCSARYALPYMKDMYRRAVGAANGKPVIISETGWPNAGSATDGAEPSVENAIKYFVDTYQWAEEDNVEIFWFSSFDESWKTAAEGDVGAYWGLWESDGNSKYFNA